MNVLRTEFSTVFEYSSDKETFTSPELMKGVPVRRLDESSAYWKPTWKSFHRWYNIAAGTENGNLSDDEHVKIEQTKATNAVRWLGSSDSMHPNQILTRDALPEDGLCNSLVCYAMATALSALQPL